MDSVKSVLLNMSLETPQRRGRSAVKPRIEPIDRPPSLTEVAADRLRTLIVEGDLPFGKPLSEHQLATLLRVSKTPVREALAQLKTEGLVVIQPHKGTFVFTPDPGEVTPLAEHWATLASSATRFAADRDKEELAYSLAEALAALQEACRSGDARAAIRAEQDFYAVPFRHCSNPYLVEAKRLIAPKILALRMHARRLDLSPADALKEAERFAAELQAGSVDAAAARLVARIGRVGSFLKAILLTSDLGENGERSVGTSNVAFMMTFLSGESLLALAQDVCLFMI